MLIIWFNVIGLILTLFGFLNFIQALLVATVEVVAGLGTISNGIHLAKTLGNGAKEFCMKRHSEEDISKSISVMKKELP